MLVFELDTKYEVQNYHEGMTDEEFLHFCMENKKLRIERDKDRDIIIMPPLTGNSSHRDGEAYFYVKLWTNQHTGRAFIVRQDINCRMVRCARRMRLGCILKNGRY